MSLYLRVVFPYTVAIGVVVASLRAFGLQATFAWVVAGLLGAFIVALLRYPYLRFQLRRRKAKGRGGWVYGFTDRGVLVPVVKIGRGSNAEDRLRSHRTAAPFGLKIYFNIAVPDAVWAETFLHTRYGHLRYRGEWFMVTPVLWFEMLLLRTFGA